jgi:L-ascorbate metabolism protein UlaG (beta-lactamase superfamily)
MVSRQKTVLSLFAVACALVAGSLAYALLVYKEVPVDPAWAVDGSDRVPAGAISVRFTGTATLLFSDGETDWMVDGWFSRPGPLQLLLGKIGPDLDAIEAGLAANGVGKLAAVFPVHSHYDHAMDAPEVARRTGALLLGSEATANIGRGWGLAEEQIRVVQHRVPVTLGKFVITPVISQHFQFPDPEVRERALGNPEIGEPLVPPVSVFDYRLGEAYVLHVAHPLGRWLIVGSAGYVEGALDGLSADVVFLGVGGLGSQTAEYRERFWRETVDKVKPSRLIPIHYDGLTAPIRGPFRGPLVAEYFLAGGLEQTREFLRVKQAGHPELLFQTLPRYAPVVLFEQAATGTGATAPDLPLSH